MSFVDFYFSVFGRFLPRVVERRPLTFKWTEEAAKDFEEAHKIDAEAELSKIAKESGARRVNEDL